MTKKIQDKVINCQDVYSGGRQKKVIAKVNRAKCTSYQEVSGSDTLSDNISDSSMLDQRSSPDFKNRKSLPQRSKKVSKLLGRSSEDEENLNNLMDVTAN